MNTFQVQDVQKFGLANSEAAAKIMTDWSKTWQSMAIETAEYTKRAFADGQAAFEKLISAKTLEQAIEIQTSYARRAFEEYMQQLTKVMSMSSSATREAYKPLERSVQAVHAMR